MDLQSFFKEHPKIALGFSGGVDSSYLLYAAAKAEADVKAYFVKSVFQPEFELEDAKEVAAICGMELTILHVDILQEQIVAENPPDRCYHCKQRIFGTILKQAESDGYHTIIDGTNASDQAGDRPGMRALREMEVLSPLRLCGLTKQDVRDLSQEAGLPTWNKPSYACLATRIQTGECITAEALNKVEKAEDAMRSMGFSDLRVRKRGESALVQVLEEQLPEAFARRAEIETALKPYFQIVDIDEKGRKHG